MGKLKTDKEKRDSALNRAQARWNNAARKHGDGSTQEQRAKKNFLDLFDRLVLKVKK